MFTIPDLVVPPAIGTILTFILPFLLRQHWPAWVRWVVSIGLTLAATAAILLMVAPPDTWEDWVACLTLAAGAGQAVYNGLKPTGLYDWMITTTTSADPRHADTGTTTGTD